MTTVSEEQLLEAVKALRITLMTFDEDSANNPKELTTRLKDDHPMWKKGIDVEAVSKALQKIKDAEIPEYVAPTELYPLELLWKGRALLELNLETLDVVGIHHAQGGLGSKGSYILACRTSPDSAGESIPGLVVLKESNPSFPAEVFASNVLRRMSLAAPRFRPLSLKEFQTFTWKLRSVPVTIPGTCGALHRSRAQESGGVLMEFLEGKQLPECDPKGFTDEKSLRDLGRCMAVDIALNCLDRTPIVWENKGNPTNILVSDHGLNIIDNTYNRIGNKELAKKHIDKVRSCAEEAKSGKIGPHAETVRAFLSSSTDSRVNVSDEQLLKVMNALHEACEELAANHAEVFEAAAKETRQAFEKVKASSKLLLDECLNLDFCSECARAMKV